MMAFISKKLAYILLFCACCTAAAIVFLLQYALAGPKLGLMYDTLRGFRPPPPVSGEILLIETPDIIEPGDIFPVLMTLSEMGAADLIVEVPVVGNGSGRIENGPELTYRINDEFVLLQGNIRNLFEAIRLGFIPPAESPDYVENLVELTGRGRDRINAAIIQQDEAGSILAARAAAVFGRVTMAADLRAQSWDVPPEGIPWYSQPQYDSDRVLRRIAPVMQIDHIVYHVLKPHWDSSMIELTEAGTSMVNRFTQREEIVEYRFPLDKNGNILIEKPGKNGTFRRLTLNDFHQYEKADREMARLLKDAEALGVYDETIPERIPPILFDYAESIKEDLLEEAPEKVPDTTNAGWVSAREEYFACLDEFLYGASEMILVNSYEERIAAGEFDEDELDQLQNARDEVIRSFAAMREKYRELNVLRTWLAAVINASLCIMGPASLPASGTYIPEASALLANTLLTGACITPGQSRYIILFSIAASLFILVCIHAMGPLTLLITGFAASLVCGAAFGISFIVSGYWIDPLIPAAACFGGTLLLAVSRFCISYGRRLRFRLAYSGSVNNAMVKRLVTAGRPLLTETLCATAAIIAAKKTGMNGKEYRGTPLEAAKTAMEFRREFSSVLQQKGALILGFENDIALACFGSPPQRLCGEDDNDIVTKAISCIREILSYPTFAACNFGIETGECAFSWSEKTGYTANGHPVIRARIFASLAARHHIRAVTGREAKENCGLPMKKISAYEGEDFFEVPI